MKERPTQRVDAAQARVQKSILFIPKPHLPFLSTNFQSLAALDALFQRFAFSSCFSTAHSSGSQTSNACTSFLLIGPHTSELARPIDFDTYQFDKSVITFPIPRSAPSHKLITASKTAYPTVSYCARVGNYLGQPRVA